MKPVHFDLAENEERTRAHFIDGLKEAAGRAPTDEDRLLVEMQGRFIDTTIRPTIEAMRFRNEALDPNVLIEAFASRVADALTNIAGVSRIPVALVIDKFAGDLGEAFEQMEEARAANGESDSGAYRAMRPSRSEGGNA